MLMDIFAQWRFYLLSHYLTQYSGSMQNAAYLAKQGLGVTGAVLDALSKAGYNSQTAKKVMIQSNESSVLEEFKKSSYELVYLVDDDISDIKNSTLLEIKTFAKSVVITKKSVFPSEDAFIIGQTNVVQKLQSANLPVYVRLFNNEFVSQAWDFFSDSSAELNNYVLGAGVDGLVTEYPLTAARYRSKLFIYLYYFSYRVATPTPSSPFHPQTSFSINGSLVQPLNLCIFYQSFCSVISIKLCIQNTRLLYILNLT